VTLEIAAPFPDTPQPAYYYVYSGPSPLSYATAPCNDPDTGATRAASTGGTWTKVIVGVAEQQNFAIWYSYYRTRLALIKSAASLAFTPLNDTKRVGFITVQPKNTPGSAAINPIRYLPVGDFNSGQKIPLVQQAVLAARGRRIAGARGSGACRPLLRRQGRQHQRRHACDRGGRSDPVRVPAELHDHDDGRLLERPDGVERARPLRRRPAARRHHPGRPAGRRSDLPAQRPVLPAADLGRRRRSVHVVTNKTNAYTDNVCSLAAGTARPSRRTRQLTNTTADTRGRSSARSSTTRRRARRWRRRRRPRTPRRPTCRRRSRYAKEKVHFDEERYQIHQRQEQTTRVTQQFELQTTQVTAQTFQTRQVQTRILQTQEQWTTAKSQSVTTTTQYVMQTDQYRYGVQQVSKHQYQTIAYTDAGRDRHSARGRLRPSGDIKCKTREVLRADPGRPSTCTTGPGPTVGPGPGYLKTTCTNGPLAVAYGPVASCAVGTVARPRATAGRRTTCDRVTVSAAAPFNGTCTVGSTQVGSPDYSIFICTQPRRTTRRFRWRLAARARPAPAPDWITTSCSQPPGPTNFAATPSLPCTVGSSTDASFVTTTCAKSLNTSGYVATCTAGPGTTAPFVKTTCTPETLGDVAVADGTCTPGTVGPS
jgi:hypothetical protein